jgi:hypothetical protein
MADTIYPSSFYETRCRKFRSEPPPVDLSKLPPPYPRLDRSEFAQQEAQEAVAAVGGTKPGKPPPSTRSRTDQAPQTQAPSTTHTPTHDKAPPPVRTERRSADNRDAEDPNCSGGMEDRATNFRGTSDGSVVPTTSLDEKTIESRVQAAEDFYPRHKAAVDTAPPPPRLPLRLKLALKVCEG